jgi:hypothetical protein
LQIRVPGERISPVRAFVGVAIAAVALGGALAMHNEVRSTNVTHYPETRVRCSSSPIEQALCQANGSHGYDVTPASTSTDTYKPGWVDPIAITLAVAGVGFGVILVAQAATRRRAS